LSRFSSQLMDLAAKAIPAPLMAPKQASILRRAVPALAPWRMLYFECRLSPGGGPIDVSQHFHAANGGAQALAELANRRTAELGGAAADIWRRISALAERWRRDAGLATAMDEICLEHDFTASGLLIETPAIFAAFRSGLLQNRNHVAAVLEMVTPGGLTAWQQMATTLEIAVSHGFTPSPTIGAMTSRDRQLRCMLGHLDSGAVTIFLRQADWPGDIPRLMALLGLPALKGDRRLLVLGFGPQLQADCGLEFIYGQNESRLPERAVILGWLVAQGLVDPQRVQALQEWQGEISPLDAPDEWPDALIVQAFQDGDRLAWLRRFVNHLKLNIRDGRIESAKAYLALAPTEWRTGAHGSV
jgi:hypothetical protein